MMVAVISAARPPPARSVCEMVLIDHAGYVGSLDASPSLATIPPSDTGQRWFISFFATQQFLFSKMNDTRNHIVIVFAATGARFPRADLRIGEAGRAKPQGQGSNR
jgi:hypothetical protein